MNCVAISASEENHHRPPQIMHNELTLTTTTPIDHSNASPNTTTGKTQSLQRTTHLYCRSLEKERVDRRTSRGLASCLRGERDEMIMDYQREIPRLQVVEQPIAATATSVGTPRSSRDDPEEMGGGGGGNIGRSKLIYINKISFNRNTVFHTSKNLRKGNNLLLQKGKKINIS